MSADPVLVLLQQSLLALEAGQLELAVAQARVAVGVAPGRADTWKTLAAAAACAGRWEDLLTAMGHAEPRFPEAAWVWSWRVLSLSALGDRTQAIQVGTAALRKFPQDPELWHALGLAWLAEKDAEAVRLAAAAIRKAGGSEQAAAELEHAAQKLEQ